MLSFILLPIYYCILCRSNHCVVLSADRVIPGVSFTRASALDQHILIDMSRLGKTYDLEVVDFSDRNSGSLLQTVRLTVLASACGKVIRAVSQSHAPAESSSQQLSRSEVRLSRTITSTAFAQQQPAVSSESLATTDGDDSTHASAVQVYEFKINLACIGISLITDRPTRRELFSIHLEGLESKLTHIIYSPTATATRQGITASACSDTDTNMMNGTNTFFNFKLVDMQIDNYSETCVYPVLMYTLTEKIKKRLLTQELMKQRRRKLRESSSLSQFIYDVKKGRSYESLSLQPQRQPSRAVGGPALGTIQEGDEEIDVSKIRESNANTNPSPSTSSSATRNDDTSFLLISLVKLVPLGSKSAIYEYIAARVLEFKVAVDSATLSVYLLDLHTDLSPAAVSVDETLASDTPARWIDSFNTYTVSSLTTRE